MKLRIYVGHAYSNDPEGNKKRIARICRSLVNRGYHPVAPQLWLDQLFSEANDRAEIMEYCLSELDTCDEFWRYTPLAGGVKDEFHHAIRNDIVTWNKEREMEFIGELDNGQIAAQ